MMNRWISLLLCMALTLVLAGCGNTGVLSEKVGSQSSDVSDILETKTKQVSETETAASAKEEAEAKASAKTEPETKAELMEASKSGNDDLNAVDLDLTVLSGTMVYSEVLYLMSAPEEYIGKTVKMDGTCACFHDEDTDVYYYACLIKDATACCSQGIEFSLTDAYSCPEDYPEIGEEICVEGEFATYEENGNLFCTLVNARLI